MSAFFYHKLNWLPLPCFIWFKSLCLMYRQYHHFKCIPLEPPINCFWQNLFLLYKDTCLFCYNIPMFHLSLLQRVFQSHTMMPFSITDHINSSDFLRMWIPLDRTVTHCMDYYDCSYLFYFIFVVVF